MVWDSLIKTYDRFVATGCVCPIAHTKIIAGLGIMLDEGCNFLAAAKIKQSIFAPCTVKSECRSSNVAPHLVHDNASYVAGFNQKRHDAYMCQLSDYVDDTNDMFCKIVLMYLLKGSIFRDLQPLIDLKDNPNIVICFGIKGRDESTVNHTWTQYYLSKLPKNGICAITGQPDYIPDGYPGNIRYPGDMAKLFMANPDKLDGMPHLAPGYIASQKITHVLQSVFSDWVEQDEISNKNILFAGREKHDCRLYSD